MACISVDRVVECFIRASQADLASRSRSVLLTGIPVTAQQMWDAVKDRARGRVKFEPDPMLQAIMDAVPKVTRSERAASLGFPHSRDIQEIVREYEEAALAHNG